MVFQVAIHSFWQILYEIVPQKSHSFREMAQGSIALQNLSPIQSNLILADMSMSSLFISNTIFCGSDYLNLLNPKWKWRDWTFLMPS